jgi:hypothetical protein
MKSTKIVKLLKTFSGKEIKEFEAFINSPSQLKKRDVTKYFSAIRKYHPGFDSPLFTDENIYKEIFPKLKFNKRKYALAAFHLFNAAKDFLVILNFKENEIERSLSLMNQLLERGMENAFEKLARKVDKQIVSSKLSLDSFFLYRYKLNDALMIYYTRKNDPEGQIKSFMNKTDVSIGLFLLRFLRSIPNISLTENFYKIKLETNLVDKVLSATDIDKIFSSEDDHPYLKTLKLIYYLYKGSSDGNIEEWLKKAGESFFINLNLYAHEEKVYIARQLMNLYITAIRDSDDYGTKQRFTKLQFDFIKFVTEKNLHMNKKEKHFPVLYFRNAVFCALDTGEFEWTEKFIFQQLDNLKPSLRKNMKNYLMAALEAERGNYEKSLGFLSEVRYDSFHYKPDVKVLLMIIYYELKLYEQANYAFTAAKKYFENTTDVIEEDRISNGNFLKYYRVLLKISEKPDSVNLNLSIREIEKDLGKIEYGNWLLDKFKELLLTN